MQCLGDVKTAIMQPMNQWVITPPEARQNDGHFNSLQPLNGFVTGDQVRPYFMRSGLPPHLLAQIWSLSDLNKDGKMDIAEFNIATHLIRMSMTGAPLPPLPDSLISSARQTATAPPQVPMRQPQMGMVPPPMNYVPQQVPVTPQPYPATMPTAAPGRPPSVPASFPNKTLSDWTIPQSAKLKYAQQFNQLDKSRVGILPGSSVRGILARSQLPTHILAEIWNLSDVNKDGCLSNEEFCIAMYLIEMVKMGYVLPSPLPEELLSLCHQGAKTSSPLPDLSQPPAQKAPTLKTFEDKRRDNYDRGQAELDRRRQILKEEEERRKQEQQRKEQEEAARRERERQEMERKREMERQLVLKREQELEEARQAEERRIQAEKAEARRKLELQRQQDLDQIRIRSLEANKRNEEEKNMHLNQRLKTLTFQKQALDEKAVQLNDEITSNRSTIIATTKEIEAMKEKRDRNVAAISVLVNKAQELSISCQQVSHQVLQAQSDGKFSSDQNREILETRNHIDTAAQTVEILKNQIQQYDVNILAQKSTLQQRISEKDELKTKHASAEQMVSAILHEIEQVQKSLRDRLATRKPTPAMNAPSPVAEPEILKQVASVSAAPNIVSNSMGSMNAGGNALPSVDGSTVKYRALYEFVARTDDELSFQPGDIILVFEGHASEPGWLAGQIKEKVGWFPQAFAEPVVVSAGPKGRKKSVPASPSLEPLERIPEEIEKPSAKECAPTTSQPESLPVYDVVPENVPSTNGVVKNVIYRATAQYQWKARNADDMTFSKGDEIEILEQQDIKWRGRLASNHSVTGWFPKSYVKVVDEVQPNVSPKEEHSAPANTSLPMYDVVPESSKPTMPETVKNGKGEWYIALYDFEAAESNDLSLKVGDRIWVTENSDDWWKGSCHGRTGTFPANYVQRETEKPTSPSSPVVGASQVGVAVAAFEAMEANQLSLKVGEKVTICSKSENGWWEGEKTLENDQRATGWFPGNYVLVEDGNRPAKPMSPHSVLAEAQFDYAATREDELSFKTGDVIEVVDRADVEWWKGRLHSAPNSAVLLFPANFVRIREAEDARKQSVLSSKEQTKLQRLTQELMETEQKYCTDLIMVSEVFLKPLANAFGAQMISKIFLNWDQLISISQKLIQLLSQKPPGTVFTQTEADLRTFVAFCGNQVSAMEELNHLENENPNFKQMYWSCCQDPNVRGLSLGYFLLLPMARVTRYPLLFEKMLKCTEQSDPQYEVLTNVYNMLKNLCSEVNHAITEVENMNMLYWSQQYINCDSIEPKLVFPSPTRHRYPRVYLHSGILYKLRSGKMLVALLFNDFLLFTTPSASISDPQSFKLSKSTDLCLNMYKMPLMLESLSICAPKEDDVEGTLVLKSEGTLIHLRAPNANARKMWENQLNKALNQYQQVIKKQMEESPKRTQKTQMGRLLLEVKEVINMDLEYPCSCKMKLSLSAPQKVVLNDNRVKGAPICTTQFEVFAADEVFKLGFFFPRQFSPDVCAGEFSISIEELVNASAAHRGPIIRAINMQRSDLARPVGSVLMKFVVQMYM
ncbi:hypothetical protein L596_005109 [Steinernema carpocapsae]|uniref:Intersectin-1 n=2 Tax=Steinernema carpocapsae TaxID=34508 RepID=A0A4U8V266_STECR|nr:hypothetical protein L596_005109 [Steinernema carpocapsae]